MRFRCVIIEPDGRIQKKFKTQLDSITGIEVFAEKTLHDSIGYIQSRHPNFIFIRCDKENSSYLRVFKMIKRLKMRTVVIPLISNVDPNLISILSQQSSVIDILSIEADEKRIGTTISKIDKSMGGMTGNEEQVKYYRGFAGFVGITPSLRERKILARANLGVIHNRSIRLAIEYWRKNPTSQMVVLSLSTSNTFSSHNSELLESWEDFDLEPWKIAMFEAQNHYYQFWKEAIDAGIMPIVIPTLIRDQGEELSLIPREKQAEILFSISEMTKRGKLKEAFDTMGISIRGTNPWEGKKFDTFIHHVEKQMKEVDEKLPHMVRPPEETGYEGWIPDKAEASKDEKGRMAYIEKKGKT